MEAIPFLIAAATFSAVLLIGVVRVGARCEWNAPVLTGFLICWIALSGLGATALTADWDALSRPDIAMPELRAAYAITIAFGSYIAPSAAVYYLLRRRNLKVQYGLTIVTSNIAFPFAIAVLFATQCFVGVGCL